MHMQNHCLCKSIRHSLWILFFFDLICFNVQKTVLVTLVCHGWGRCFVHMQISGAQAVRPDFTAHRPSSYMLFPMMKRILPKHGSFSSSWYVSQEGSAQCNRDNPTGHQKSGWILIPALASSVFTFVEVSSPFWPPVNTSLKLRGRTITVALRLYFQSLSWVLEVGRCRFELAGLWDPSVLGLK